jgi:hypothetical protein
MIDVKVFYLSQDKLLLELNYDNDVAKTCIYYELTYTIIANELVITGIKPIKNLMFYLYDNYSDVTLNEIALNEDQKAKIIYQVVGFNLKSEKGLDDYYRYLQNRKIFNKYNKYSRDVYDENKRLLRSYMNEKQHEK